MPAPAVIPADPKLWRKAFIELRPSVSPCPGPTGAAWAAVHAVNLDFLDRWAEEAASLGWTTLDLFSVHPKVGAVRVDYCGALMLAGEPITAVTEQHMKWKNATRVREMPGRPNDGVPLWLFGR